MIPLKVLHNIKTEMTRNALKNTLPPFTLPKGPTHPDRFTHSREHTHTLDKKPWHYGYGEKRLLMGSRPGRKSPKSTAKGNAHAEIHPSPKYSAVTVEPLNHQFAQSLSQTEAGEVCCCVRQENPSPVFLSRA